MSDNSFPPQSPAPRVADRQDAAGSRSIIAAWVASIRYLLKLVPRKHVPSLAERTPAEPTVIAGPRDFESQAADISTIDDASRQRFDRAISSLSATEQQLVVWRTIHFVTYREIAHRLKIPERVARRKCQDALAELRKVWSNEEHSS